MGGGAIERKQEPHWARAISGGLASMTAECFTLPVDTIKVRLQLDKGQTRLGAVTCLRNIIRNEGVFALWKVIVSSGLASSLLKYGLRSGSDCLCLFPGNASGACATGR